MFQAFLDTNKRGMDTERTLWKPLINLSKHRLLELLHILNKSFNIIHLILLLTQGKTFLDIDIPDILLNPQIFGIPDNLCIPDILGFPDILCVPEVLGIPNILCDYDILGFHDILGIPNILFIPDILGFPLICGIPDIFYA